MSTRAYLSLREAVASELLAELQRLVIDELDLGLTVSPHPDVPYLSAQVEGRIDLMALADVAIAEIEKGSWR